MINLYSESWKLYKAHTQTFKEDLEYYVDFTNGYKSLELFSGYGRLTNQLVKKGISIESVELDAHFASLIDLPPSKNHICNVVDFKPSQTFERIFAAYNSFCLLTNEADIKKFFHNLGVWLSKQGKISLSYYHPNAWEAHNGMEYEFKYNNHPAIHIPRCDLTKRKDNIGIWIDEYRYQSKSEIHRYPTRIYENQESLAFFLQDTDLIIENVIIDYNLVNIADSGWIEYVLSKRPNK